MSDVGDVGGIGDLCLDMLTENFFGGTIAKN